MSKRYNFVERADVDSALEKKCQAEDADLLILERKRPEAERAAESLNPKIFDAYQDFKKSEICGNRDAYEKWTSYLKLLNQKRELSDSILRKIEVKRSELSTLLMPLKSQVIEMLHRELEAVQELYSCEAPQLRVGPNDKILPAHYTNLETGARTMKIKTNGWAIRSAKELLIKAPGDVNRASSLQKLKEYLGSLSKKMNELDFQPIEIEAFASDFEDLSRKFPAEVGFLIEGSGKPPVVIKESAKQSRSIFDSDRGLISGRNPW
jgi:hypothetical protein